MDAPQTSTPENSNKRDIQLCEIAPSDLDALARFIIRASGSETPLPQAVKRLSWILLENPARESDHPLGWLLRARSGEIVGCMCCAPQKFCLGQTVFTLMMANSFYVDDQYRGAGTSIFLKYLQLGRRYPLFVSSANPTVAEMWQKLGAYPLGNSNHELLAILRWAPLIAENVYRKTASDPIARSAAALASPLMSMSTWSGTRRLLTAAAEGELVPLNNPEEALRICEEHRSDNLTSCRDTAFLNWRYFANTNDTTRLFAFRPSTADMIEPKSGDKKQFMVAVELQDRGYKRQIRTLQILDIWGEADPQTCLAIAASLCREYREQIDMLVFRCLNASQEQTLAAHGFKVRPFAAPIAWCLDKHRLLSAQPWYFVPADGDMFL
jgi:hypothetical protein